MLEQNERVGVMNVLVRSLSALNPTLSCVLVHVGIHFHMNLCVVGGDLEKRSIYISIDQSMRQMVLVSIDILCSLQPPNS